MPHFKFTLIIILVFIPFMLLLTEYISHASIKVDSDTATRQAAQSALKQGILKGSLRDADLDPTLYTVIIDAEKVKEAYDNSFKRTMSVKGTLINPAKMDESIGIIERPPMIAIRSNIVRESSTYGYMKYFFPNKEKGYVIQNQKITILEAKRTS
ncbi:hypothetical protein [Calidifontibacillus erzurumensis]|uniref:hypothetical protein n=1 Tax=Calidifontibacillus erzurumensis TaxID=2741433 RepID=UPI0035B5018B